MPLKRVDILQPLFERLKRSSGNDIRRALLYGLPEHQSGSPGVSIVLTIVKYINQHSLEMATRSLPCGLQVVGILEFDFDEDQDLYGAIDNIEDGVLLKVVDGKVSATTGFDFLRPVHLNVLPAGTFWEKSVTTFHIRGQFLVYSLLEIPDLEECFAQATIRVLNQSAYTMGAKNEITLLPHHGQVVTDKLSLRGDVTVAELVRGIGEETDGMYFRTGISVVSVHLQFDTTKSNSTKKATILISDTSARCKLFEHYLPIDYLVVVPKSLPSFRLYKKFNMGFLNQLKFGFHYNVLDQLLNSISAERPEPFHFWLQSAQNFVTMIYPDQTSEEKLKENRLEIHDLLFIKELRPIFRRSAALFQPITYLVSPHLSLQCKGAIMQGYCEYKHYMQDDFNDDGWGCAYRSLQTIVSWFRLQGFTSRSIPTHKEIQECLVSLGDKPGSVIGSKLWIGSTEVSFVLEALLGVSCRIMSVSSGTELSSSEKMDSLRNHFRTNGTPVMIGGSVYAHTIIGVCDESEEPSFLVYDPHWNGKEDIKTIIGKGWVGWKDTKFWSPTDFYNVCMPIPPITI